MFIWNPSLIFKSDHSQLFLRQKWDDSGDSRQFISCCLGRSRPLFVDQFCVRQAIFSASMAGLFSWNSRWIVHRETLDHRPTICRQLTSVVGRSTFWNLYFLNVAKHTLTDDRKSTWSRLIYRAILTKRLKGDRLNTDYIKHLPPMGRWAGARRTTPCIRLFSSANWRNAHVVTD